MLARTTNDAFRTKPEGTFVAGASWLYFCADPSLYGFVLWEVPSESDMAALVRLMEDELVLRPPHAAYVDVRRLRVALSPSFGELAKFFVFMCSPSASYCVGSTYYVDGGWLNSVA